MEDFSNAQNISFTMPDVSVVMGAGGNDEKNPYLCTLFDLSQMLPSSMNLADKHHVAMFSPILDTDSAAYVHHMILYACEDEDAASGFQHGQVVPECESMPRGCNALKWPWAVGSEPVVFPPQAGMPMGQGQKWFALQMHYYNPSLTTGIKDSSGVRVTFATRAPSASTAARATTNVIPFQPENRSTPCQRPMSLQPVPTNGPWMKSRCSVLSTTPTWLERT